MREPFDLSPAKWIWLPSERCLPNTFVLFRREAHADMLAEKIGRGLTDSRRNSDWNVQP